MKCFFSGTDKGELHDNAPNHNWYLSLIVNFEDYDKWCVKIAREVDEKLTGNVQSVKTFRGENGEEVVTKSEELDRNNKYLYLYDGDISTETIYFDVHEKLIDRMAEIKEAKKPKYINSYGRVGKQIGFDYDSCPWLDDVPNIKENSYQKQYSYERVKEFLYKVFSLDMTAISDVVMHPLIAQLDDYTAAEQSIWLDTIEDNFEEWAIEFFGLDNSKKNALIELHFHYITERIEEILRIWKTHDCIRLFCKQLDVYNISKQELEEMYESAV